MPIIIQAGAQSYEALVGSQLLEKAGLLLSPKLGGRSCAIVSDDNIGYHLHAAFPRWSNCPKKKFLKLKLKFKKE